MAIDKRGPQRYRVRIAIGRDGGARQTYSETVHGTKKEAEARERALIAEFERGALTAKRTKQSLNEFLAEWLATVKSALKNRTHEDYTALVSRYMKDGIGKHQLDKLTPMTVQHFYNELTERGLSARTVKTVHTVMKQALRQAVQWRMLAYNPCNDIQLPKHKGKKVMRALDLGPAALYIQASREHRYGAALRTALESGMRPQELCAVMWSDLDWHQGFVSVNKAMVWPKGGGWLLDTTKTPTSVRRIALSPTLLEDLREHRKKLLEWRLLMGPEWKAEHEWIFPNSFGRPLNVWMLNQAHKQVLALAGLPRHHRLYDLRHTSSTLMLAAGESPKVASERLGHSTITLTMDTYSHVMPSMQKETANKMERLLHDPKHKEEGKHASGISKFS